VVELADEDVLVPSDTTQATEKIGGLEVDAGVGGKVGIDHRARCTGVHENVRDRDGHTAMRDSGSDEDELMP
jgi:hypothetical protein